MHEVNFLDHYKPKQIRQNKSLLEIFTGILVVVQVAVLTGTMAVPQAFATNWHPHGECKIEITKTVDKQSADPGDNLIYKINFKNIGTADCTGGGVKVYDKVDTMLTFISGSKSGNVSNGYDSMPLYHSSTRELHWNAHTLKPGEAGWVKWTAKVNPITECGEYDIANTAKITAKELDNFHTWVESNTVHTAVSVACPEPDPEPEPEPDPEPEPEPEMGTLVVVKIVVNDNGGTAQISDFALNVSAAPVQSGAENEFAPGSYMVGESGGPSGYNAVFSGDCDEAGNIIVAANHTSTCTITNDDEAGTLLVKKIVSGSEVLPSEFSFTVNGGEPVAFENDGENEIAVNAGSYTVAEPAADDYDTIYENCSEIAITNGGSATCTITNAFTPPVQEDPPQHDPPADDPPDVGGPAPEPEPAPSPAPTPPPSSGGGGSGGGPSYTARIDFQSVAEKTVGQNATESVTLTNTGSITIPTGELKITFPTLLTLVSSNPGTTSVTGNVAIWSVPPLSPNSTFTANFTVVGSQNASAIVSVAQYSVSANQLAQNSAVENVGSVAGGTTTPPPDFGGTWETGGAEELPRTGTPVSVAILIVAAAVSAMSIRKRIPQIRYAWSMRGIIAEAFTI